MIRLLIVEGQGLVRDGLAALIQKTADIEVIASAGDVAGALAVIEHEHPDVVLTELSFRDGSAMELLSATGRPRRNGRVVVVTESAAESPAEKAIVNGAAACIHKSQPVGEMLEAIRSANRDLVSARHELAASSLAPQVGPR
jgi:two-component system response regulator DesR